MALSLEEIKARRKAALGKGDGAAAKPAPFARAAPAAEAPAEDDAITTELPLARQPSAKADGAAKAAARKSGSPDDSKVTVEFDLTEKAKETSDVPPPPSVPPVAAPVPAPAAAPLVRKAAPASAVPVSRGKLPGPDEELPAPAEKPPKKDDIVAHVLDQLKPLLNALEQRLGARVGDAEDTANKAMAQVSAVVDEIGEGAKDADIVETDGEGKETERRPTLRKAIGLLEGSVGTAAEDAKSAMAQVSAVVDEIGESADDADIVEKDGKGNVTETRPTLRKAIGQLGGKLEGLTDQETEALSVLRGLLGRNYGRLHMMVVSHEIQTRKLLVNHLREDDYLRRVNKIAVEQEPAMVKMILGAFVTPDPDTEADPVFGVMKLSLAQAQNSSIEKLEKNPALAKWVEDITPQMVERAKDCLEKIDWEACEAANRKMIFGGDE